jgi:hypothetical protein
MHLAARIGGLDNLIESTTQILCYVHQPDALMDGEHAYIWLVAYSQSGERCHASHMLYGNRILVVPRSLNDVHSVELPRVMYN